MSQGALGPQLDQLGLPTEPPELAPAVQTSVELPFYRGETERLVLDGLLRAGSLLRSLELAHPNSVQGTLLEWDVTLSPGTVAPGGTVQPPLEL